MAENTEEKPAKVNPGWVKPNVDSATSTTCDSKDATTIVYNSEQPKNAIGYIKKKD